MSPQIYGIDLKTSYNDNVRISLRIIIGALIIGTVSGVGIFNYYTKANLPDHAIVIKTENGFSPWKVLIKKGGTVTFKSETGKEYWPASDTHPSHAKYPEFDPAHPILPGEEWSFTFDKAGAWKFHDHLAHEFTGVVVVAGEKGEEIGPCLELTSKQVLRPECWEVEIFRVLASKGLDAALETFASLYQTNPIFRDNCHFVTHVLGNNAYLVFEKDHQKILERPELLFCNSGFFHGFFKAMSEQSGYKNFDEILLYCEKLRTSEGFPSQLTAESAARTCFFSLGKTILRNVANEHRGEPQKMVSTSMNRCERLLTPVTDRTACAFGVFNELGLVYGEKAFGLSFGDTPPANVCKTVGEPYQLPCYMELPVLFTIGKKLSFEESVATIRNLPTEQAQVWAFQYLVQFSIEYGVHKKSREEWVNICQSTGGKVWQEACIEGAIRGFSGRGLIGEEYQEMLLFCRNLSTETNRQFCHQKAGKKILGIYASEELNSVCQKFPTEYQIHCVNPEE